MYILKVNINDYSFVIINDVVITGNVFLFGIEGKLPAVIILIYNMHIYAISYPVNKYKEIGLIESKPNNEKLILLL